MCGTISWPGPVDRQLKVRGLNKQNIMCSSVSFRRAGKFSFLYYFPNKKNTIQEIKTKRQENNNVPFLKSGRWILSEASCFQRSGWAVTVTDSNIT